VANVADEVADSLPDENGSSELVKELNRLTTGRSVEDKRLYRLLGPNLRRAWGVNARMSDAEVKQIVAQEASSLLSTIRGDEDERIMRVYFNMVIDAPPKPADKKKTPYSTQLTQRGRLHHFDKMYPSGHSLFIAQATANRVRREVFEQFEEIIKERLERPGSNELPPPPPPPPWWRSRKALIYVGAFVLVVALGSIVSFATLPNRGAQLSGGAADSPSAAHAATQTANQHPNNGFPVGISTVESGPSDMSSSYVFKSKLQPSPADLAALNQASGGGPAYEKWFDSRGGAFPQGATIQFTLTGNAQSTALINDMTISKTCSAPYTGTYFDNPPEGQPDAVGIKFDLDQPNPIAMVFEPHDMTLTEPYFSQHAISLKPGELQSVYIVATTTKSYCSFTIQFTATTSAGTTTETISDNGKPFQVSAQLPNSSYQAMYVGGVGLYGLPGNPTGWTAVNPKTYGD